jgi:hypothetical protein
MILQQTLSSLLYVTAMASAVLAQAARTNAPLSLRNMPVTGVLADGGRFAGTLTIERFAYDGNNGLIVSGTLSGTARGRGGTATPVSQAFSDVPVTLNELGLPPVRTLARQTTTAPAPAAVSPRPTPTPITNVGVFGAPLSTPAPAGPTATTAAGSASPAGCDVLHLDVGAVATSSAHVDPAQIALDLTAPSAAGPLGEALCAVAGHLDAMGRLSNLDFLSGIQDHLDRLNGVLR